jgi:hypothetical protein
MHGANSDARVAHGLARPALLGHHGQAGNAGAQSLNFTFSTEWAEVVEMPRADSDILRSVFRKSNQQPEPLENSMNRYKSCSFLHDQS